MKKTYLKPDMRIVQLEHQHQLLVVSGPRATSTNLPDEEEIVIDPDQGAGTGIWSR